MTRMAALARSVAGLLRWRAAALVGLALLATGTEGVGILLLVPLLALVGVDPGGGATGRMAAGVEGVLGWVGVEPSLPVVVVAFFLVVASLALLRRAQAVFQAEATEGFSHRLRTRLHAALLRAEWTRVSRLRSSDVLHALTEEVDRASHAAFLLLALAAEVLVSGVFVMAAFAVSPAATGVALACAGVVLVALRRRIALAHGVGVEVGEAGSEVLFGAVEQMGALKVARSYGAEERHLRAFEERSRWRAARTVEMYRNHADVELRFRLASAALAALVLYVALAWLRLPAAAVLVLLVLFARLAPRLSGLASMVQGLLNALPGFERVQRLTGDLEASGGGGRAGTGVRSASGAPDGVGVRSQPGATSGDGGGQPPAPLPLGSGVELRGVRFRYPDRPDPATLDGVDLMIPTGRMTALVGPSGAGKSTIADMLLGLLVPDEGEVLADSRTLTRDLLPRWRETVAYVPQDTFLFHDSIRDNLLWARPGAEDAELERALRLARADAFVARLPQGLDTVVGDRGVQLSGGERQRIALARALLRRPALLVLDEATSALDQENEGEILRALAGLGGDVTVLLITHRLAAVAGAERVHLLDGGRVVWSGAPETLPDALPDALPEARGEARGEGFSFLADPG